MPDLGRIAGPLKAFVEAIIGRRLDYHALYPSTVVSQNANGDLALLPDDDRVRGFGLDPVPIKTGIPGVTVTVAPNSRVLLGFEAADPKRPYAALWDASTLVAINITASASVTVNAPVVDLAAAVAAVLRDGEGILLTGVFPAPGLATLPFVAAVNVPAVNPLGDPSDVKA